MLYYTMRIWEVPKIEGPVVGAKIGPSQKKNSILCEPPYGKFEMMCFLFLRASRLR